MHRIDVQMSLDRCLDKMCRCAKSVTPDGSANSRSRSLVIRLIISFQWRVKGKGEHVVLVVQMVRVLAHTARGVGLSPTWCYFFPCIYFRLFTEEYLSYIFNKNTYNSKFLLFTIPCTPGTSVQLQPTTTEKRDSHLLGSVLYRYSGPGKCLWVTCLA